MKLSLVTAAFVTAALTTAFGGISTAGTGTHGDARMLPVATYEPAKLLPGEYRTRPAFVPLTTFRVGSGWYGSQNSSTEWVLGKTLDRVEQRFTGGAIYVEVLPIRFVRAVFVFKRIPGLVAGRSTPTRIGRYSGATFRAKVKGDNVPLLGLGTGADITGIAGQQTFLDLGRKTMLIRTEHGSGATPAAVRAVLRTLAFPRH